MMIFLISIFALASCDKNDEKEAPYVPTFTSVRAKNVADTILSYPEAGVPSDVYYVDEFDTTDINVREGQNSNTHIQGISRYKNFMVVAINGNYEIRKNAILLILKDGAGIVQRIETPLHIEDPELDVAHASGFQITGDYLFMVTSWHGFSANRGSDLLVVYDLSPLQFGGEAQLYHVSAMNGLPNTLGISTVKKDGVELLVWAGPDGNIRTSPVPTRKPDDVYDNVFNWTQVDKTADSVETAPLDAQSCAMVTDENEELFFFKLCNTDSGGVFNRYEDFIAVYKIELVDGKAKYTEVVEPKFQVPFKAFAISILPATFRFAGTVEVKENGDIWTYSTVTIPYSEATHALYYPLNYIPQYEKYIAGEIEEPPILEFQFNIWRVEEEETES